MLLDKISHLQKKVNDKNILISSKLEQKVETYPSQVTKSPWLKNVTFKTKVSQYTETPALCQNLDTPIKPTTNSDTNKGDQRKLEMPLNEIRKTHHKTHHKTEIIGQVSRTKVRKCKNTQKKLENQITDATKLHHQKYQKSRVRNNNSNKDTHNNSYTDADTDNIASPNKWSKDTVLLVGDSKI